jgi:hypothetical protein
MLAAFQGRKHQHAQQLKVQKLTIPHASTRVDVPFTVTHSS